MSLTEVGKNPLARVIRYDGIRFAVPKKFPYAAHYIVDEAAKIVIIQAVFGFAENPEKWVKL